jgi:NADH-quinone oxidoreductase subunit L
LHISLFSEQVQQVLPVTQLKPHLPEEIIFQLIAVVVTLSGIYTGYALYYRQSALIVQWQQSANMMAIRNFLLSGWKFDQLYDTLLVKPFLFITRINKSDVIDKLYTGIADIHLQLNKLFSFFQNGSLRWYVAGVLIGILFIITLQLLL